jgi:uncharacterized coiled-coil protein SlyX
LRSDAEKIAAEVEDIQEKITSFGVSADCNSVLEEMNKSLIRLENQLKLTQAKLQDLPGRKKGLQEMVLQCELVRIAIIIYTEE